MSSNDEHHKNQMWLKYAILVYELIVKASYDPVQIPSIILDQCYYDRLLIKIYSIPNHIFPLNGHPKNHVDILECNHRISNWQDERVSGGIPPIHQHGQITTIIHHGIHHPIVSDSDHKDPLLVLIIYHLLKQVIDGP